MTLMTAAKSHPDVIVQAVAARDRSRAEEFAKKNGIPCVRDTYQGTITMDCLVFFFTGSIFDFDNLIFM